MRILLTGGGTGGHAYPILTVFQELKKNAYEDIGFLWIGSKNSIEENIAVKNGIIFKDISVGKLRRYFSIKNILDFFKIPIGIIQSFFIIKKFKPDVIFSKGGFVSVPAVIAGKIQSIPVIVHESDIIPGLANRISFRFAEKKLLGFEPTKKYLKNTLGIIYTGVPVSKDILEGKKISGIKNFKLNKNKKTILVIGGSQGANSINQALLDNLSELLREYQIIHICGQNNFSQLKSQAEELIKSEDYHLLPQLNPEEMGQALAAADIVISRSGASALSEIASLEKPAILIPLSRQGSRGDQIENAKYFSDNNAAIVVREDETLSEELNKKIKYLLEDQKRLKTLSKNIAKLANVSASVYIASIIEEYGYRNINLNNIKKAHFVGIGGIGVSAISRLFKNQNIITTGSDAAESKVTDDLKKVGMDIVIGRDGSRLINKNTDILIYTVAADKNNPDIIKAKKLGVRCLSYPQILSILTRDKYSICVSGSHGKTTTTAITSVIFEQANLDPTVIVGSNVRQFDGNARLGNSKYFILEADEYKRAFLKYYPNIAILTSVEYEHPDIYRNLNDYLTTFKNYISRIDEDGILIANKDDDNIVNIAKNAVCKKYFYGIENEADLRAENIRYVDGLPEFDVKYKDKIYTDFKLMIPGQFNISNALAAILAGILNNISIEEIKKSLQKYKGSWRRFEIKYDKNNQVIIDDYAHHPTEIKATLGAARKRYPNARIICVYQPHQKKRTKELFNLFKNVFDEVDLAILVDIYEVMGREEKIDISSKDIADYIDRENVKYVGDLSFALEYLKKNIQPKDVIITMGAGTITNLSDQLVEIFNESDNK